MTARTPVGIHATSAKALAYQPIEMCHCLGACECKGHDGRDDEGRHCQGHLALPLLTDDCPSMETGCLCQTKGFNCEQGRKCPYRQPKPSPEPDPDAMAYVARTVRFVLSACGVVIAIALVVLPQHPDFWWPEWWPW